MAGPGSWQGFQAEGQSTLLHAHVEASSSLVNKNSLLGARWRLWKLLWEDRGLDSQTPVPEQVLKANHKVPLGRILECSSCLKWKDLPLAPEGQWMCVHIKGLRPRWLPWTDTSFADFLTCRQPGARSTELTWVQHLQTCGRWHLHPVAFVFVWICLFLAEDLFSHELQQHYGVFFLIHAIKFVEFMQALNLDPRPSRVNEIRQVGGVQAYKGFIFFLFLYWDIIDT